MEMQIRPEKHSRRVARLKRLAHGLDSAVKLPGGIRVGLDSVLGFIPVVGDAAGAAISTYIIVESARLGASTTVIVRMMANVLVETVVGVVPLLGDLFDVAWKSNNRNVQLLEKHLERAFPQRGIEFRTSELMHDDTNIEHSSELSAHARIGRATLLVLLAFVLCLTLLLILGLKLLFMLVTSLNT